MAKRNLNEILGFISRWGNSDFSSRLLDEALTSAAIEKVATMAEKDKPTSIRARQLRARGLKRLEDEKKLEAIIKDKSPQNQSKREKALKIRDKMTSYKDTEFDPSIEGQQKDPNSGKVLVGSKKPKLEKPEKTEDNLDIEKTENPKQTQDATEEKPKQTVQTKKKLDADIIDVLHAGTRSFENILGATRAAGGLIAAPAGTSGGDVANISQVVSGVTGPIRNIQGLFGVKGIPRQRILNRYNRSFINKMNSQDLKTLLQTKK